MPRRSGIRKQIVRVVQEAYELGADFPLELVFETPAKAEAARKAFYRLRAKHRREDPDGPFTDWLYRLCLTVEGNVLLIEDLEPEKLFTVRYRKPPSLDEVERIAREKAAPADQLRAVLERAKIKLRRSGGLH